MTDIAMRDGVRQVETIFFLLLMFVVAFGALAKKLQLAYPIVLVIAGLIIGFIPGLPRVSLNPDVIFLTILPPLLFNAAWQTSWREFHYNLASILMLAFGLVAFTVIGVALASGSLFSILTWPTGIVLGAIVAPTDALAATSIARRVGLPERLVHVLEGESLVNDATGLLALEFGIALVVDGHSPGWGAGIARMVWLVAGGIGVGIAVGWLVRQCEMRLDDAPIQMTLTLIAPYAGYFAAEEAHASGVLAVVACGLYLGRHSSEFYSPRVRLQANALWNALDFILNGLAFVLIGLQLPVVLAGLHAYSTPFLVAYALGFTAFIILLRVVWAYPGAYVAYWIRRRFLGQNERAPSKKTLFILGWTGMRGVVSLAAALSLPETLANGHVFASRNLIVFLTFSVILFTLVFQGLSLPALVRAIGLAKGNNGHSNHVDELASEENEARRLMLEAALARAIELRRAHASGDPTGDAIYEAISRDYQRRLAILMSGGDCRDSTAQTVTRHRKIANELFGSERRVALALRRDGRINDVVLRRLENELDLAETRA